MQCAFLVVMNLLVNSCQITYVQIREDGCRIQMNGDSYTYLDVSDVKECNLLQMQLRHLSGNGL